jgi:hypothetical protein
VISLKLKEIIHKTSFPVIEKSRSVPITKTDALMIFMQTVAVYFVNYGKHKDTSCNQNIQLLHF